MIKWLKFKKLIILLLLLVFIMLSISAIVMGIAPSTEIARLTHWKLLGLTKHTWGNIHAGFGVALVSLIFIHLYINRKILFNCCKIQTKLKQNTELLVALLLVIIYFIILCLSDYFLALINKLL